MLHSGGGIPTVGLFFGKADLSKTLQTRSKRESQSLFIGKNMNE
jgi:hypothetical protein